MPRGGTRARVARYARPAPRAVITTVLTAALIAAAAIPGAAGIALRLAGTKNSAAVKAAPAPPVRVAARSFAGTPAVGALFSVTRHGALGRHFCTASVVHSPRRDLLITAAHCLPRRGGVIDFVPGYSGGTAPYGTWTVTKVITDQAWSASADQDDDVAFLVVRQPGARTRIEDVTGAERLRTGAPAGLPVRVIGYPDAAGQPVTCAGRTSEPLPDQLEFDCRRFTDGTSGGPFLLDPDPLTGDGYVVGVIGGYEQGGDLPQISYAAAFGRNVAALYQAAVRQG